MWKASKMRARRTPFKRCGYAYRFCQHETPAMPSTFVRDARDALCALPHYLLPAHLLSAGAGALANARMGGLTHAFIRWFARRYRVDMTDAALRAPEDYASFNDFFTRALRAGARPLGQAGCVSPADGVLTQFGAIEQGRLVQAKGRSYSAAALLAGDEALAGRFAGGQFACIYLSPRDYHRVHMPCDGTLEHMAYVPGRLMSVNPALARAVPELLARNERVVCVFRTAHGLMALVLVGAAIVGSVATVWHGRVHPPRRASVQRWDYAQQGVALGRGEEMGRFLMGSTVVALWQGRNLRFDAQLAPDARVRMGQSLAEWEEKEYTHAFDAASPAP